MPTHRRLVLPLATAALALALTACSGGGSKAGASAAAGSTPAGAPAATTPAVAGASDSAAPTGSGSGAVAAGGTTKGFSACEDASVSNTGVQQRDLQKSNLPWFTAEQSRLTADAAKESNATMKSEIQQMAADYAELVADVKAGKNAADTDPTTVADKLAAACGFDPVSGTQSAPPPAGE